MIKNLSIFSTKLYNLQNRYLQNFNINRQKHDAPTTLINKSKRESNMHGIQRGNKCHFQQNVDFVLFVKILHHNVIQKRVI